LTDIVVGLDLGTGGVRAIATVNAATNYNNYQLQEATKQATISTSSSGAIGLDT
jgi:ribulose kinase